MNIYLLQVYNKDDNSVTVHSITSIKLNIDDALNRIIFMGGVSVHHTLDTPSPQKKSGPPCDSHPFEHLKKF